MKRVAFMTLAGFLALPFAAAADTWKNVTVIDTLCLVQVQG
jgi:hypothetical protein